MRKILQWGMGLAILGGGGYAYYIHQEPCRYPIAYTIGTFDNSFGISQADFLDDIQAAAQIWDSAAGKQLFAYNSNRGMPINLIYDNRQKLTQQDATLTQNIDQAAGVANSVKEQFSALQAQYLGQQQEYEDQLGAYNQALASYNTEAQNWNNQQAASPAEYSRLSDEKTTLETQRQTLENQRTNLNALADQINALIDKYNLLASHVNANVAAVNSTSGETFNEGEYISSGSDSKINIYEFSNKAKLVRVLAHELGHALGLEHNNNPASIMYALNQSTNEVLSTDDKAELAARCGLH